MSGLLALDDRALASCVSCGLCLPHCPTFRVTGDEAASPRGRIAAMRLVQWQGLPLDTDFERVMDSCVQCRGCEPVCPSAVPFGALMEGARSALVAETRYQPWWRRLGYRALGHQWLVLLGSSLAGVGQRLRVVPSRRLGIPRLPVRRRRLTGSGDDVWLFTGCVMDAWQRPVHAATMRVLTSAGVGARPSGALASCCGALAAHAGLEAEAGRRARQVMSALPGTAPVLVNAAGCGAMLKGYGSRLDTPEARAFSARVFDVHEWLAERMDALPAPPEPPGPESTSVAVADPCHLRHVQGCHRAVRTVLAPFVTLVELDDEGLCCGAGGAYSITHPELAGAIRDRKMDSIARAGADVVASANPGCALYLAAAGAEVRHPMEILADCLSATHKESR